MTMEIKIMEKVKVGNQEERKGGEKEKDWLSRKIWENREKRKRLAVD